MTHKIHQKDESDIPCPSQPSKGFKKSRILLKFLLPLLVITLSAAGAAYIQKTTPKPSRRSPQQLAPLVQTIPVQRSKEQVVVQTMGSVIPAQEIVLKSRVAGEIIFVHSEFIEGGYFKAGEEMFKIDPTDYELAVIQQKSQVENALYELKLEMGQQDVAKREWQLFNKNKPAGGLDKELALREPQLKKAKADLLSARADLKQAKLNLSRTQITAPFNALIRSKDVAIGSQISTQEQLAVLVGTDEYWVQVFVPVDRLKWIQIPRRSSETGSSVVVYYGNGEYTREGMIVRLLSDLETEGRMARLLVSVKDPVNLEDRDIQSPPVLIGEYVRVEIKGRELTDVISIPRTALRDNDKVWVAQEGKLKIRPVEIVWRDKDTVFLKTGIENGEALILSNLSTPVDGMAIHLNKESKVD